MGWDRKRERNMRYKVLKTVIAVGQWLHGYRLCSNLNTLFFKYQILDKKKIKAKRISIFRKLM